MENKRTTSNELKPCPFCGTPEANIDYGEYTGTLRGGYYVMCLECGAEITSTDMRSAFEAWNRRSGNYILVREYTNKEILDGIEKGNNHGE